ncbi:MAG: hypothetical protein LAP21_21995, partial [Acidobacteriia bacterium]|nr:hypothetical protein [Terriglobia bacterium]
MNLGIFSTVLAIVGLATEAALAAVLAYCRRHRQFPFFYTYAFYALFLDASAHPIKAFTSQTVYFNFYWASQVVYTILGVLAMNESFRKVLQPYFLGKWWFRCLVPGVAIIIL